MRCVKISVPIDSAEIFRVQNPYRLTLSHIWSLTDQRLPIQLVVPKHHGAKLTDIPDESLFEVLPVVKKIAAASGASDWNLLQNNGREAHQVVDHVSVPHSLVSQHGFLVW